MSGVLVVYATKNGSTRDVAEAGAADLVRDGFRVTLAPAGTVKGSLGDRDLVVLGGAIYSGRWRRDAHRFLKRHRAELATLPVAVFGMGPRRDDGEAWQRSRDQLDRALAGHPWLSPLAVTVFGGVDPPRRSARPRRDIRDWSAIGLWADDLERLLPPARAVPGA